MSWLTSLVVCVLYLGAAGEADQISLDATRNVEVQGLIIRTEAPEDCPKCFEVIVTQKENTGGAGGFISRTGTALTNANNLLGSIITERKLATDELTVNKKKVPADRVVAADFKLYVAVHITGDIRVNSKQEEYFNQDTVTYAGYAKVSYRKDFLTAYPEKTDCLRHYWLCAAFGSLTKELKCQAIWVREGSHLGVAWGGDGWCQEVVADEEKGG